MRAERYFARFCAPETVDSPLLDNHLLTLEQAVSLARLGVQVTLYKQDSIRLNTPYIYLEPFSGRTIPTE